MTTLLLLRTGWDWSPSVVLGCALLLVFYGWAVMHLGGARLVHGVLFSGAVAVLLLALESPLDLLGDHYLFSAHMVQHLLLLSIVPPMLLLGLPPRWYRRLLSWAPARGVERRLGFPLVAWLTGVVTLWAWHAPALFNAALASERVHVVQHLTFLVSGVICWWPVASPLAEQRRLAPWATAGYLILGALANSILGIILTFTPPGAYPLYLHPADPNGLLPLIRGQWGLTPLEDQQLGGGLMWMLGGWPYLLAIVLSVARWFRETATEPEDYDPRFVGGEPAGLTG